jgi:hypothetical protein
MAAAWEVKNTIAATELEVRYLLRFPQSHAYFRPKDDRGDLRYANR